MTASTVRAQWAQRIAGVIGDFGKLYRSYSWDPTYRGVASPPPAQAYQSIQAMVQWLERTHPGGMGEGAQLGSHWTANKNWAFGTANEFGVGLVVVAEGASIGDIHPDASEMQVVIAPHEQEITLKPGTRLVVTEIHAVDERGEWTTLPGQPIQTAAAFDEAYRQVAEKVRQWQQGEATVDDVSATALKVTDGDEAKAREYMQRAVTWWKGLQEYRDRNGDPFQRSAAAPDLTTTQCSGAGGKWRTGAPICPVCHRGYRSLGITSRPRIGQGSIPPHTMRPDEYKTSMKFTFDVDYAETKDSLMAGEVVAGTRRVTVDADTLTEAELLANQMVAATGNEPTGIERVAANERERVFACPEHAPIGIKPQPNDDGYATCAVCGKSGYHVKPFDMQSELVERGWRAENFEVVKKR